MSETLGIDYAWKHPNPAAICKAGYRFVLRYLSADATKNLSASEVKALHAAGLRIGLVWETTSTRATAGFSAGRADRLAAERMAAALRYPHMAVIYWACDEQVAPARVMEYARGWWTAGTGRPTGPYGDRAVIEAVHRAKFSTTQWQTQAWSGADVSIFADLYQRVKRTRPAIPAAAGSYDENVMLRPVALWAPAKPAPAKPMPKKPSAPPVTPPLSPQDSWRLGQIFAYLRRLFGKKAP